MEYFFKLQRKSDKVKIIKLKNKSSIINKNRITNKFFKEYENKKYSLSKSTDKNIKYVSDKISKITINNQLFFLSIFSIIVDESYGIRAFYNKDKELFENYHIRTSKNGEYLDTVENIKKKGIKYKSILANIDSFLYKHAPDIASLKYCEREKAVYDFKIHIIYYLFDFLQVGGNFFMTIFNYCNDEHTINLLYLLSFMFEYVIIFEGTYICAYNFLDKYCPITKDDFEQKILNKVLDFDISPKYQYKELIDYIQNSLNEKNKLLNILLNKDEDEYIKNIIIKYYKIIELKQIKNNNKINFTKNIIDSFRRILLGSDIKKITSCIKSIEGNYIQKIIKDNNFTKCLEIGMAHGISAIYILQNSNTSLISIDPFQKTQWNSDGLEIIKSLKFDNRHEFIEKKSYEALPELLKLHGNNTFDCIFIDGWHTFDYTLIDFFYSDLLLKPNGIIIIDDALHNGVKATINYITTNYLFYRKIDSPITLGAFKKIKDDDREWNFHVNF